MYNSDQFSLKKPPSLFLKGHHFHKQYLSLILFFGLTIPLIFLFSSLFQHVFITSEIISSNFWLAGFGFFLSPFQKKKTKTGQNVYLWLEALAEASLITSRNGKPYHANRAYRECAHKTGLDADIRPPSLARLLGGRGDLSPPLFRLARAARQGLYHQEYLGAISLGQEKPSYYQLSVAPLFDSLVLWRLTQRKKKDDAEKGKHGNLGMGLEEENAPIGLFRASASGRVMAINACLRRWSGVLLSETVPLESLLGASAASVFLDNKREGDLRRVDVRWGQEGDRFFEGTVMGVWSPQHDSAAPPFLLGSVYPKEIILHQESTGKEVSEDHNEEKKSSDFPDFFTSAPFGVAYLEGENPETALLGDANTALMDMTEGGATPGTPFKELFKKQADAMVFSTSSDGDATSYELELLSGQDVHVYFVKAEDKKVWVFVLDISQHKDLERRLFQAQKMQAIGQLAGGVAHDFNNLLTAIRLNCDELLGRHPVGDPSYPELQKINQTVARAASLVRKLLAFSRKQTVRTEVLNVGAVLSDFSILLRQILEEKVQLDIQHGLDLPFIKADKSQLETAIMNLAVNARDAMREKKDGRLTIRTQAMTGEEARAFGAELEGEKDYLLLEVRDNGCGMDNETLKKIYEPFFTTKPIGEGTGLGLATVYGIVQQAGGSVLAKSKEGEGTQFFLFLPACTSEEQEKKLPQPSVEPVEYEASDLAGRGLVLLVEDEDAVRSIAAKTLRRRGYDVLEAEDGEKALAILQENRGKIDVMVTDVVMPGMDGVALLEAAHEYLGHTRVIFISGYAEDQFSETLARHPDVSFLPKPFTLSQLAEYVKKTFSEKHL